MLCLVTVDDEIDAVGATRGEDALKHRRPLPHFLVHRIRQDVESRAALRHRADARGVADGDELLGMRDVERPQQYGVDEREDRRIGADAEGQRQHDDERETEIAAQRARGVREVLNELLGIVAASHGAFSLLVESDTIVANGLDIAELSQRLAPRRVRRHAAGDQTLRAHVEMKRQLVVHGLGDLGLTKDETERAAHR